MQAWLIVTLVLFSWLAGNASAAPLPVRTPQITAAEKAFAARRGDLLFLIRQLERSSGGGTGAPLTVGPGHALPAGDRFAAGVSPADRLWALAVGTAAQMATVSFAAVETPAVLIATTLGATYTISVNGEYALTGRDPDRVIAALVSMLSGRASMSGSGFRDGVWNTMPNAARFADLF
ncbi:MAG: hypothetical protein KDE14_01400 [Rhodobacteraceae bacterium]|nr:hypothetical protein [Paracoccaceae bacterium]